MKSAKQVFQRSLSEKIIERDLRFWEPDHPFWFLCLTDHVEPESMINLHQNQ
jgi:hypothetical protein